MAFSYGGVSTTQVPLNFLVSKMSPGNVGLELQGSLPGSINVEWFSRALSTTDAMLYAPAYPGSPYIENGMGQWDYDSAKCSGTFVHSARTYGCPGQAANDEYNSNDAFNIGLHDGSQAIVPGYKTNGGELCYPGHGDCHFEFFLR